MATAPQPRAPETPFRVEVVTVTGLVIASTFPLELSRVVALGYLEDDPELPLASGTDRIGLRTVVLRFYAELLAEAKRIELLDDDGVAWLVPAERVLAIRVVDPARTPGPPSEHEVRHVGFQLRRPGAPMGTAPVGRPEPHVPPDGGGAGRPTKVD